MKYVDAKVVFSEVPDEITLAISISNCPGTCKGCHSPWLRDDVGDPLTKMSIHDLLEKNEGITCICFMGGDRDTESLKQLIKWTKENYPKIKTAWYSGLDYLKDKEMTKYLNYLKLGSYKESMGPLDNPHTNQVFYQVLHTQTDSTLLIDITYKFWKKDSSEK